MALGGPNKPCIKCYPRCLCVDPEYLARYTYIGNITVQSSSHENLSKPISYGEKYNSM